MSELVPFGVSRPCGAQLRMSDRHMIVPRVESVGEAGKQGLLVERSVCHAVLLRGVTPPMNLPQLWRFLEWSSKPTAAPSAASAHRVGLCMSPRCKLEYTVAWPAVG